MPSMSTLTKRTLQTLRQIYSNIVQGYLGHHEIFTLEIYTNEPIKVLFHSFVLILVDKLNLSMMLSGYKVLQFS